MVTNLALIGATCSPTQCQFVINLNAFEYQKDFSKASMEITKKHYVDNYLDSVDTIKEVFTLAKDVTMIHSKADFLYANRCPTRYKFWNKPQKLNQTFGNDLATRL